MMHLQPWSLWVLVWLVVLVASCCSEPNDSLRGASRTRSGPANQELQSQSQRQLATPNHDKYKDLPTEEAHYRFEIIIEEEVEVDVEYDEAEEELPEPEEVIEVEPNEEDLICIEKTILERMPHIADTYLFPEEQESPSTNPLKSDTSEGDTWGTVKKVIYKPDHGRGVGDEEVSVRDAAGHEVVYVSPEWKKIHEAPNTTPTKVDETFATESKATDSENSILSATQKGSIDHYKGTRHFRNLQSGSEDDELPFTNKSKVNNGKARGSSDGSGEGFDDDKAGEKEENGAGGGLQKTKPPTKVPTLVKKKKKKKKKTRKQKWKGVFRIRARCRICKPDDNAAGRRRNMRGRRMLKRGESEIEKPAAAASQPNSYVDAQHQHQKEKEAEEGVVDENVVPYDFQLWMNHYLAEQIAADCSFENSRDTKFWFVKSKATPPDAP